MSKGLDTLQIIRNIYHREYGEDISMDKDFDVIERELKQAEKDKEMLDIFKNAITIEREIPPELEIKESEKGSSYVFREAIKIHENRIEEMLKKSLRKWVLKNAFPKELKALEIIKNKKVWSLYEITYSKDYEDYINGVPYPKNKGLLLNKEEYNLLKEVVL